MVEYLLSHGMRFKSLVVRDCTCSDHKVARVGRSATDTY